MNYLINRFFILGYAINFIQRMGTQKAWSLYKVVTNKTQCSYVYEGKLSSMQIPNFGMHFRVVIYVHMHSTIVL